MLCSTVLRVRGLMCSLPVVEQRNHLNSSKAKGCNKLQYINKYKTTQSQEKCASTCCDTEHLQDSEQNEKRSKYRTM